MARLIDDITYFLESKGFICSRKILHEAEVIVIPILNGRDTRIILPLEISASSVEEAERHSKQLIINIKKISSESTYPLIIPEDRWRRQRNMIEERLLSHLEVFSQAYARNCEVRKIGKAEADEFLNRHHSYGTAACRYRYGLFLKRHTGHIAEEAGNEGRGYCGKLIAVATFSNARKWIKEGREIRSYEWTRYSSLPGFRVSGGMGKLLKAFIKDIEPDDIMSYADLEWSEGDVYRKLGFTLEDTKEPVMFRICKESWKRTPLRFSEIKDSGSSEECMGLVSYFRNFGSNKYRLKLTDYK